MVLFFRGRTKAAERDAALMRWAVWHVAALPLMKTFPKAKDFIEPPRRADGRAPRQTQDEIWQAMRRWTKTLPPRANAPPNPKPTPPA